MDNLIRLSLYLILGAVLLFGNIWYLRALRSLFPSSDYVIMPIRVVGKEDPGGALGIALAQMLQARLKNIAENLAARSSSSTRRGHDRRSYHDRRQWRGLPLRR